MRSSLLVRGIAGESCIIDTGPEFRLQAIRAGITHLDAIFLTHPHADHLHGLDDVRPLCHHRPLPVYGNRPTIKEMQERFSYVFKETQVGGGKPKLTPIIVNPKAEAPISIGNLTFTPLEILHGRLSILGWSIQEGPKQVVYITDASEIPSDTMQCLRRSPLDVLILGALRLRPHPTHFSFEEAVEVVSHIKPRGCYVTHICHDLCHRDIATYLAEQGLTRGLSRGTILPAYDGLSITIAR
ncbi:MAG: MBL fold metallo-hydrolase [Termitinemataceae bacterium]